MSLKVRNFREHELAQFTGWIPSATDHLHHWSPHPTTMFSLRTQEGGSPIALVDANGLAYEIAGNIHGLQHLSIEGHFIIFYCRERGLKVDPLLTRYVEEGVPDELEAELRAAVEVITKKAQQLAEMAVVCSFDIRRTFTLQKAWAKGGEQHLCHH